MLRIPVLLVAVLLLVCLGCSEGTPQIAYSERVSQYAAPEADPTSDVALRRLIRSGKISLEVESVDQTVARLAEIVSKRSGYLADSEFNRDDDGRKRGQVTLRVAADGFDSAIEETRQLGTVESESLSTQDIGKEYFDLETRLRVAQATEARLRGILEERTGSVPDVLEVERELSRVIGGIEKIEGEKRFFDQQLAMSSIELYLHEPGASQSLSVAPIGAALSDSLRVLIRSAAAVIYVVVFLLPWLLIAAIGWWVATSIRRRLGRAA